MPKITVDGEEYQVEEITGADDLHVIQESTIWDRVSNRPRVDLEKYTFGIMLASLKSWSRKDSEGKPVPVSRETVGALPRKLFAKLSREVTLLNFEETSPNFQD